MLCVGTWQSSRKAIPFFLLLLEYRCQIERVPKPTVSHQAETGWLSEIHVASWRQWDFELKQLEEEEEWGMIAVLISEWPQTREDHECIPCHQWNTTMHCKSIGMVLAAYCWYKYLFSLQIRSDQNPPLSPPQQCTCFVWNGEALHIDEESHCLETSCRMLMFML